MKKYFLFVIALCSVVYCFGKTSGGHEYVDLGLPSGTMWATCNMGASTASDFGDYYMWGYTTPTTEFGWANYKYASDGNYTSLTKYCINSEYGEIDGKSTLDSDDDAAKVVWGGNFRIPNKLDAKELLDYCTITSGTKDGVSGYFVTGPNGNFIFFPTTGKYYYYGEYIGSYCTVWLNYTAEKSNFNAGEIIISDNQLHGTKRSNGMPIRPVYSRLCTSIKLSQNSANLAIGQTINIAATVLPKKASNRSLVWESSDTNVATVDESGKVTAIGKGNAMIKARSNDNSGLSDSCSIIVDQYVTSIALNASTITLWVGKSKTLTATVAPTTAINKSVQWTSSDPRVADVSANGKVKAMGKGTCTITCTAADGYDASATCAVTVKQQVTSVDLGPDALTITAGTTKELIPTITPTNANVKTLKWKSTDISVAEVSSTGVLMAITPGTTSIICTSTDGFKKADTCTVTVTPLKISDNTPEITDATYGVGGIVYSRKLTANKYSAFCLPYSVNLNNYAENFSNVYVPTEYAVLKSTGTLMISLDKVALTEIIPAGQIFVVRATKTGSIALANSSSVNISSLKDPDANQFKVYNLGNSFLTHNTDIALTIAGNYTKLTGLNSADNFSLSTSGAMSKVTTVAPYRFYVTKVDSQSSAKIIDMQFIFDDDEATGIENILRNGPSGDKKVYNLNGQRVNSSDAQRGIYIINGKKVIRK